MIERVHQRLLEWAEAVAGGGISMSSVSPLGRLMGNGGVYEPPKGGAIVPVNSDVRAVESFVLSLPEDLARTVCLFYLPPYLTHDQAAKKLKISMKTLYRRIDGVHVLLNAALFKGELPRVS